MTELLSAIVTWLSVTTGIPAYYEHPSIEFVSTEQISDINYGNVSRENRQTVSAIYDDTSQTIYLSESWSAESSADLSVLVHEMVHHLQNLSGADYDCPGAREKPAYAAQDQWLNAYQTNLFKEFELDKMTLKIMSLCYWL